MTKQAIISKKLREKRKKLFFSILGGKCNNCGSIEKLEFDHIIPETRVFVIGRSYSKCIDVLLDELKKCQLLCLKCHRYKSGKERRNNRGDFHGRWVGYFCEKCRCRQCKDYRRGESKKYRMKKKVALASVVS